MNAPPAYTGDLTDKQVIIGETAFHFEKLLPLEAFRAFEAIRPGLGDVIERVGGETDFRLAAAKAIFLIPPDTVNVAMQHLFRAVSFTNSAAKTPVKLAGMEDTAFMGLEPVAIYEVLMRAFMVNFTASWDALASRIPDDLNLSQPDTSTSQDS